MIKNFKIFLNEGLLNHLTGPSKEDIIENFKNEPDKLLSYAIKYKDYDMMQLALDNGADVNSKVNEFTGAYPLQTFVWRNDKERIKMLLDLGADPLVKNGIIISNIVDPKYKEYLEILLSKAEEIHGKKPLKKFPENHALIVLIMDSLNNFDYEGVYDVVEILLKYGADPHTENEKALRMSVNKGQVKIVELLLKYGADVNVIKKYNRSFDKTVPLENIINVVKLLVKYNKNKE